MVSRSSFVTREHIESHRERRLHVLRVQQESFSPVEVKRVVRHAPKANFQAHQSPPSARNAPEGDMAAVLSCAKAVHATDLAQRATTVPKVPSLKRERVWGCQIFLPRRFRRPELASPGKFTTGGTNAQTRTAQEDCPAGSFCLNGEQTNCPSETFTTSKGQSECSACLSQTCNKNQFRNGCGGSSDGKCAACEFTRNDQCESGVIRCSGNTIFDSSSCQKCKCEASTTQEPYWKKLTSGDECPECIKCTYTEANCNSGMYLDHACTADATTNRDSECKNCADACQAGEYYNADCGGTTAPSCTACKTECGECAAKSQENCAAPRCEWNSGTCVPHRLTGQFPDENTRCTGKDSTDTTVCLECSSVPVPADKYMVDCQADSDALRFKDLTKCIAESTYETTPPTRTSDRVCGACKKCREGEFQAVDCSPLQDTVCVPVSVPGDGEYVFETATETRDAVILPISSCALSNQWQDLSQPYEKGSAYVQVKMSHATTTVHAT